MQAASLRLFRFYKEYFPAVEKLRLEYAGKIHSLRSDYQARIAEQAEFIERLNRLSPVGLYDCLASILCRTDVENHLDFLVQSRMYRNSMLDYFQAKDIYHQSLFFTNMPESKAALIGDFKKFWDATLNNYETPEFRRWQESKVPWEDTPPLGLKDFPRFSFHAESLGDSLARALPEFAILVLLNLAFLALGYFSFSRYDPR